MHRAFELEIGHFALDSARVRAVAAGRQDVTDNIAQEPTPQPIMAGRVNQLEFGNGRLDEAQGLDKAEAVGIQAKGHPRLMHDEAHDEMRQEQGVQLLNDAEGFE